MKKFLKVGAVIIVILVTIVFLTAVYVLFFLPNVGTAPNLKVERTAKRIDRGKYLVNSVSACMSCHGKRDFKYFAGPVDPATHGAGGEKFGREMGFPGNVYPKNITPYALGKWSDGEIYRALVSGVDNNGKALFPIMPYERYANMDSEDVYSIIAYLRSLKPVKADPPKRELDFPLNFIVNTIPAKATPVGKPAVTNPVEYGRYLVNAASCSACHTKEEKGDPIKEMEFAGGEQFNLPSGKVFSANITPDKKTGIGNWTKEQFLARFKMYRDSTYRSLSLEPGEFNTIMPWLTYSTMIDKDLEAIYAYLRTVKPVNNKVEKFLRQ